MLKRIVSYLLVFGILFSFASCTKNDNGFESDTYNESENVNLNNDLNEDALNTNDTVTEKSYILQEVSSTGQIGYGMFNTHYLSVSAQQTINKETDTEYFDDIFRYRYDGKYGYADANGNVLIKEQYEEAGPFSEGKALVRETSDSDWKIIDTKGNVLKSLSIDIKDPGACFFQNGSIVMYSQPSYEKIIVYILNSKMEMNSYEISKPKPIWTVLRFNTEEFTGVAFYWSSPGLDSDYQRGFSLYDATGKEVWSLETEWNKDTEILITECFPKITVNDGYANVFDENGKWGLLNVATGKMVVECQYDYIGKYNEGVAPVKSYNKWGYIDANGELVLVPTFDKLGTLINNRAFAITADRNCLIVDKSGKTITTCSRYWEPLFLNSKTGIASVRHDLGGYTVINRSGETLLSDESECFATGNYVFFDDRMYKIVEQ